MRSPRFNHLFTLLLALGFLSAFAIPPARTQRFKPNIQVLLLPASWPAAGVGRWISGRTGSQTWDERRDVDTVKAENAELRAMVMNLTERLKREQVKSAQREAVSARLRDNGVFVATAGADAGTRQTLQLRPPVPPEVVNGMYATYSGGVVGVVQNAGVAGASVRLVSDVGFRVNCGFARLRKNEDGRTALVPMVAQPVVVEGVGNNTLKVVKTGLTMDDAIKAGLYDPNTKKTLDGVWAFVDKSDRDWPDLLHGQPVGQVERIAPRDDAPLFAEVTLHPATNLSRLREVLVVTKE